MELWLMPREVDRLMRHSLRDLDRIDRALFPYWKDADHSILHVANETQQMVNDDKKFAVSLDVSQFHPEELNVHIDGRELTIEGKQEHKTENSFMNRSFVRKWILPENVDVDGLHTQLDNKGHLCVEAPKLSDSGSRKRNIPIMAAPSSKSSKKKQ
ncbi:Hsp20/alpha crystallin family protein [Dictyocaulus viviparus]|uniref:Hsp20/alpha crystallin family protein n=1 Tax=Dictyocaulus viviparus TaxID=29172 RepID=A0A0D8XP05_DICVI|nr:Hsp20/alpha crystallin family protein [Dictyocaulus viviparus]